MCYCLKLGLKQFLPHIYHFTSDIQIHPQSTSCRQGTHFNSNLPLFITIFTRFITNIITMRYATSNELSTHETAQIIHPLWSPAQVQLTFWWLKRKWQHLYIWCSQFLKQQCCICKFPGFTHLSLWQKHYEHTGHNEAPTRDNRTNWRKACPSAALLKDRKSNVELFLIPVLSKIWKKIFEVSKALPAYSLNDSSTQIMTTE